MHDNAASPIEGYECIDIEQRDVRALCEKMTVLPLGGEIYSVTTESGSEYRVDVHEERCTCPDYQYRDVQCKHIRRVAFATGQRPIPVDTDDVDSRMGEHTDATPRAAATDGGIIVADDDGEILDDGKGRPSDCECLPSFDSDAPPCFICWQEGFRSPNPDVDGATDHGCGPVDW